jgi:hypothetical protein
MPPISRVGGYGAEGQQVSSATDSVDPRPDTTTQSARVTCHIVRHGYWPIDVPAQFWLYALVGVAAVVAFQITDAFGYLSQAINWAGLCILLVCLLGFGVWSRFFLRRISGSRAAADAQDNPASSCKGNPRLVCHGKKRELSDLRLDGQFREPFVATAFSFQVPMWIVFLVPVVLAFMTAVLRVAQPLREVLLGGFYLFVGSVRQFSPHNLYYRVVPQRLDVLRGTMWMSSLTCEKRIPLDNARIVCRFEEQKLYISLLSSPDEARYRVDLQRLTEPHAFVKAVFEAAVSPHPTPPLPDDALLG